MLVDVVYGIATEGLLSITTASGFISASGYVRELPVTTG